LRPEGKFVGYFFLVGFLVAFFFAMVLFSLGLDLAALVPGFFFTGIEYPPLRSLLPDERKNCSLGRSPTDGIIEMRYALIKRSSTSIERNFKFGLHPIDRELSEFKITFRHKCS
jgi:hypothetical protein